MKPSEFIKSKLNLDEDKPNVLTGQYTILAQYIKDKDFKELDLRFIDKEELKEKIKNKILNISILTELPNYKKIDYKIDNTRIKELKEILKLLE